MSYADKVFIENCKDILENGTSTEGELVRPHWEDGTPAYTIKQFGIINRYDLSKEFPALTLRKVPLKSALDEILWIYQKKSNKLSELNSHVWDSWDVGDNTIGTCYGWVIGNKFPFKGEMIDQTDYVLKQLKETPFSRRIMTNMYQYQYLSGGGLDPCCYSMTYNVTEKNGKRYLNAILNQRSQDMLAANGWNICQYSLLLMMMAQVNNMIPGEIVHVIADCHIYDRHIPIIEELITRPQYEAPIVKFNPEIKNFYDFTVDDLIIENYNTNPQIKNIPIAI